MQKEFKNACFQVVKCTIPAAFRKEPYALGMKTSPTSRGLQQ